MARRSPQTPVPPPAPEARGRGHRARRRSPASSDTSSSTPRTPPPDSVELTGKVAGLSLDTESTTSTGSTVGANAALPAYTTASQSHPALSPDSLSPSVSSLPWASAVLNGGLSSVPPDVQARVLTFQKSRQSRSNSGSNGGLPVPSASLLGDPLTTNPNPTALRGAIMSLASSQYPASSRDTLSRSSSSGSQSSTGSYTHNISSLASPAITPHADDHIPPDLLSSAAGAHAVSRLKELQQQQAQVHFQHHQHLQGQIRARQSASPLPSVPAIQNRGSPDTSTSPEPHLSGNKRPSTPQEHTASLPAPSPDSHEAGLTAPLKPSLPHASHSASPAALPPFPGSASPNFSGALAVNPSSYSQLRAKAPSLSQRRGLRGGLVLSESGVPKPTPPGLGLQRKESAPAKLPQTREQGFSPVVARHPQSSTGLFSDYRKYVDIDTGSLNFAGKASLHSGGIDFSSGSSFRISLHELEPLGELGRGNYGTVTKVLHKPTGVIMAMKEIRLELDETKFRQIIMELDILHKCVSPFIVDFYGAFFIEGAVYMCMEYMDGGSLNKIYDGGIREDHLALVTDQVIRGLMELKDKHNIIHRDVKPTNILVSSTGRVKLCDFGVSGNLVASIARTNVGCQSYMAPERIRSKAPDQAITYTVESDVWSLGLSLIEMAEGKYPYPPDTYDNIFSQLSAIVDGDPPMLPDTRYSEAARSFVSACLNKVPSLRPPYSKLLEHKWLVEAGRTPLAEREANFGAFVRSATSG